MEIMEGRLCEHVCACKRVCACVRCQQLDGCQLLKAERLNPLGETRRASNHRHNPTQLELLDRRRPSVLTHSTHINTSVSQKHALHSNGIKGNYRFCVLMGILHAVLSSSAFCFSLGNSVTQLFYVTIRDRLFQRWRWTECSWHTCVHLQYVDVCACAWIECVWGRKVRKEIFGCFSKNKWMQCGYLLLIWIKAKGHWSYDWHRHDALLHDRKKTDLGKLKNDNKMLECYMITATQTGNTVKSSQRGNYASVKMMAVFVTPHFFQKLPSGQHC